MKSTATQGELARARLDAATAHLLATTTLLERQRARSAWWAAVYAVDTATALVPPFDNRRRTNDVPDKRTTRYINR